MTTNNESGARDSRGEGRAVQLDLFERWGEDERVGYKPGTARLWADAENDSEWGQFASRSARSLRTCDALVLAAMQVR